VWPHQNRRAVLVATLPADSDPALQANVNGSSQSVDLKSGKLRSAVSQMEYHRSGLVTKINQQARTNKKMTYKEYGDKESEKATWTWTIKSAGLSAFDPTRGWAGNGKAWLVVSTSDYDVSGDSFSFESKSDPTVTIGKKTYKPDLAGDTDWDEQDKYGFAFKVPATAKHGTFNMRPSGKFTAAESDKHFTAPKSTVKFRLPK
jgi:hypothetical protein